MSHYLANLRDLEFTLFDVLRRDEILGSGPYADLDLETAHDMLGEVARLAIEEFAPSMVDSDRNPPVFDPATHSVAMPESFKRAYAAYLKSEWWRTDVPAELDGQAVPPSLRWALAELVLGSNPAIHMYSSGFAFSRVLYENGTPEQTALAKQIVDRHWGATMVLTEPDAGSDVGAGRTTATEQPDGSWHLNGVKRFITSGETDLFDNIVHFVLARPTGAGPGTKGLSLFIVPKFHVNPQTGELGDRNGVFATNLEHKMGLKASSTCEIRFGEVDGIPAVGTLLGGVHDGIAQMFKIIEFARMMVGTKAIATLSTGYLNALAYAKERVQGADLAEMANKAAPRVTITHHPDVRRSLMLQKAYSEGLRALVLYTATQQDAVALADARGEHDELAERLNDLLLPIVKGCGSERSWVVLGTETLQTFGGSGFLQDYPIEQYVRDAKIDTLYEGTTAIQGMDFFFRKIVRDRGHALQHLSGLIGEFVKDDAGDSVFATERELLGKALDDVQGIVGYMINQLMASDPRSDNPDPRSIYLVGQNTSRLLLVAGDLVVGWLLLRAAEVARAKLDGGAPVSPADRAFYTGKIAAARFFAKTVLPRIGAERAVAESTDNDLMDLDEAAF
jgi:alkylation response protein AidB-like acyl-CoA dehydrogenase